MAAETSVSLAQMLDDLERGANANRSRPMNAFPTGFQPLDHVLNGGLRAHDLTVLGGAPAVGKTVVALQWARNMALNGASVVYVCYEHDEADLLARLLMLEIGQAEGNNGQNIEPNRLRTAILSAANGHSNLRDVLEDGEVIAAAHDRLGGYADRLHLVRATPSRTGLTDIERMLTAREGAPTVVFVDYLQKIRAGNPLGSEADRITAAAEGLKEIALHHDAAVVAIVAADMSNGGGGRLRMKHLRGAGTIGYESDVVLMLNEKTDAVSRVHLAYDSLQAKAAQDHVVISIEKNRGGPADLHMEFRKDLAHFRFDTDGRYVSERLADEGVDVN